MTSPIDPIRRAQPSRRTRKTDVDAADTAFDAEASNLPVPVGKAHTVEPPHPAHGQVGRF